MPNQQNFLGSIMRGMRRIASAFREKPTVTLDDYVMEHFMMYHGLVGTSPQDQPQFKDVREQILQAILRRSSVEMAIALKVPPLWWEDKLSAIIGEAHQYHEELIECLLPERDPTKDIVPESDPLMHPDWRVRSNAAKILAEIGAKQAIPNMVQALNEATDTQKPSFIHIIYSLSRLQTDQSRNAVAEHVTHDEPWFRVDALGALSKWPLAIAGNDVARGLISRHPMSDYAAVAVAKNYKPTELLNAYPEAGAELVIGLVEAARGPFINDTVSGADLEAALPHVNEIAQKEPTPRHVLALLELTSYLEAEYPDNGFGAKVLEWFRKNPNSQEGEYRHALKLAAHYKINEAAPEVERHLQLGSPLLDDAIEAAATIGGAAATERIVQLISELVDFEDRTSRVLSKQPVFEENPEAAKTYWLALKALGSLATDQSAQVLLKATKDFAPDKRQQAFSALIQMAQDATIKEKYSADIESVIRAGLGDPSPSVRATAITGVEKLRLASLIPESVRLTAAKEPSVVKQARRSLAHLAQDGYAELVTKSLKSALSGERDTFRRQRLSILLEDISQGRR
jgi:HEAT repeat protein